MIENCYNFDRIALNLFFTCRFYCIME